jgi:hypothetical protein
MLNSYASGFKIVIGRCFILFEFKFRCFSVNSKDKLSYFLLRLVILSYLQQLISKFGTGRVERSWVQLTPIN